MNRINIISMQACCPKGSWPQLAVEYAPNGETLNIEGVTVYHSGEGERALFIFSDIFGIDSGRHFVVADIFASSGYNVFLPQILNPPYDGSAQNFPALLQNIKSQNLEGMEATFNKVLAYLNKQGITKFVSFGFCWGVWFGLRMASKYDCFKCFVGFHPAIVLQKMFYEGTEAALIEKIKCPAYFMPGSNDEVNLKEKGQLVEILEKRFGAEMTGATFFEDMLHGWVTRGDLKDEKVARDFHKAIHIAQDYFAKFK